MGVVNQGFIDGLKQSIKHHFQDFLWDNIGILDSMGYIAFKKPALRWDNVPWQYTSPPTSIINTIVAMQENEKKLFMESVTQDDGGSTHGFACRFFAHGSCLFDRQWFNVANADQQSKTEESLDKLCSIMAKHVRIAQLSAKDPIAFLTPLTRGFETVWWICAFETPYGRNWDRHIRIRLRRWLEILQQCGVDLDQYGRQEAAANMMRQEMEMDTEIDMDADHEHYMISLNHWNTPSFNPRFTFFGPKIPLLARIDYGCNPEDWSLHWDYFRPDYAQEFWSMIEMLPRMPGSWVED